MELEPTDSVYEVCHYDVKWPFKIVACEVKSAPGDLEPQYWLYTSMQRYQKIDRGRSGEAAR